ncbi:hypothetical protein [Streptomyces sp. NPDC057636]|uniref:hypothetical protein n=1 Tax=Streptomyces sp. NPDC057636 TaxID=3346189 RepID=UPI0036886B9F
MLPAEPGVFGSIAPGATVSRLVYALAWAGSRAPRCDLARAGRSPEAGDCATIRGGAIGGAD